MSNKEEEAIEIVSGSVATFPSTRRFVSAGSNVGSPLRFELKPNILSDITELSFTLAAIPMDFLRAGDRTQTGYSVGCFEAHFRLNIAPGQLRLDAIDQAAIEFTGTLEDEQEKGVELKPKVEIKAGTEGVGVGGEFAGYTRKRTERGSSIAKGGSDDPRLKCLVLNDDSHFHWIMTPSPVRHKPVVLQHSVSLSGKVRWPDARRGEIEIWGRRYVFGDGAVKLSGPGQLKAKFVHWLRALKVYNDRRPERFELVEAK